MSYKTLTVSAVYALALAGVTSIGVVSPSTTAKAAPKIPCKTAKLIVPWKAGGGAAPTPQCARISAAQVERLAGAETVCSSCQEKPPDWTMRASAAALVSAEPAAIAAT